MIYLDNAATTKMSQACAQLYMQYAVEDFYNPSAPYRPALECANAIKQARETIAQTLGATADEIYFTASGSEADNIALLCAIKAKRGNVLIGSSEHSAVYETSKELERRGYAVRYVPCDGYGRTDLQALRDLADEETVLVSVMHACNETGAINDLDQIVKIVRARSPQAIVHSDGVQAFGKIPVRVKTSGVDLYSVSAHKIHGPKGIGALYCRKGLFLRPFVFGGGQEKNVRSATENVGAIAAFAHAAQECAHTLRERYRHASACKNALIEQLRACPIPIRILSPEDGSPYIVMLAARNARGEVVAHAMQDRGVLIGTGSACATHKATKRIPSALGLDAAWADGIVRVSFCEQTTLDDVQACAQALKESLAFTAGIQRS